MIDLPKIESVLTILKMITVSHGHVNQKNRQPKMAPSCGC